MSGLLLVIGWALLAVPGVVDRWRLRWSPAVWVKVLRWSNLTGFLVIETGLILWAAPAILRGLGLASLAELCARIAGHLLTDTPGAGWVAAAVAVGTGAAGVRAGVRTRLSQRESRAEGVVGRHFELGHARMVVVSHPEPVAYAVPGDPPQVVVSSALLDRLDRAESVAVIAHEVAHLRRAHPRMLIEAAVVEGAFGRLPGVARSLAAWRLALELEADRLAVGVTGDRCSLRNALLKVTLTPRSAAPAFGSPEAVATRLVALDAPAVHTRWGAVVPAIPGILLGVMAAAVVAAWIWDLHLGVAFAGICPL